MGEYLEARGRRVDVVFGLLRPGALALVAVDLFMEAVTLPADDVGVVRCRLAGRPAALVDVDGGHFLDVAGLARVWPKLVAELFERAGQEDARALLASPTLVRPLEALKEILVENEVHADALYDLGRGPLGPRLASVARAEVPPSLEVSAARAREGAFSFEFPRGKLTLTYTHDAFGRLIDSYRDPADDGLVPMYTAPATMLNGRLTAQRALALARLDLERIRRIAQQREVKINDVVMALCGGALRRYLAERNALPAKPLIASMPVAMARTDGDAAGNAIVTGMVSLATHLADPLQRLATVHGSSAHAKELIRGLASQTALTIYMTVTGLPYILAQLAGQAERVLVHNLVLSNVHGVSERRYINGALIEAEYPISLLVPGQAMNITVISHADQLDVAVLVCPSLVPQPQRVADAMCEELDVLERACRGRRGRGVAAKSAKAAAGRAAKPSPAARQVARPKRGART